MCCLPTTGKFHVNSFRGSKTTSEFIVVYLLEFIFLGFRSLYLHTLFYRGLIKTSRRKIFWTWEDNTIVPFTTLQHQNKLYICSQKENKSDFKWGFILKKSLNFDWIIQGDSCINELKQKKQKISIVKTEKKEITIIENKIWENFKQKTCAQILV